VIALVFAVALWRSRGAGAADRPRRHCNTRRSAFAFGAGIMAVELPTAFMYFGAISAILAAHAVAALNLSLLVIYNALFVAPLLAILAIRLLSGDHADRWLAVGERWLRGAGQIALAVLVASAGMALMAIGVSGLVAV
jgi:hypothetical protein